MTEEEKLKADVKLLAEAVIILGAFGGDDAIADADLDPNEIALIVERHLNQRPW